MLKTKRGRREAAVAISDKGRWLVHKGPPIFSEGFIVGFLKRRGYLAAFEKGAGNLSDVCTGDSHQHAGVFFVCFCLTSSFFFFIFLSVPRLFSRRASFGALLRLRSRQGPRGVGVEGGGGGGRG